MSKTGISSSQLFGYFRVPCRESLHVHFVDERLVPRNPKGRVLPPTESGIHDHALGQAIGIIALIFGQISLRISYRVAEQRIAPAYGSGNGLGVWIQEKFGWVEPVTFGRS